MNNSNPNKTYGGTGDEDIVSLDDVFANLNKYHSCSILAVIAILGLAGDIFCLRYLAGRTLQNKSYTVYLIVLAVADIITLLGTGLPVFLEWTFHGSWRREKAVEICITFHCILEFSENLSSLLMLAIAVDRYIAVVHPLRRPVMCNQKRAKKTSIGLVVLSVLLALPDFVLLGLGLESLDCRVSHESVLDFIEKNRFIIFSLVIPVLMTLFLNSKVLCTISKAKRARAKYLDASGLSLGLSRRQLRITVTLVTLSIISALLLLPVVGLEIWEYFLLRSVTDARARKDILANASCASRLIEVINISINFFPLMCITSENCFCLVPRKCRRCPCCKPLQVGVLPNQLSVVGMHQLEVQV